MAQQHKVFVAFAEDRGSIPSTHMATHTICNSNHMGYNDF